MVTKQQAVEFAKGYGWTKIDAERAYDAIEPKPATEQDLRLALIAFAGPELIARQRSQAGFKGAVTKKNNEIAKISQDYQKRIQEGERKIDEMRSTFIPVIERIYTFAQKFGLSDDWIEALLETYKSYTNKDESA